eukprot:11435585-Ditylum_brightwellii.AAC.1
MEARSIHDNLFNNSNWVGDQAGSARAVVVSSSPATDPDPKDKLLVYLFKLHLCNDDINCLLKAYCCPLHKSDGHILLQY